MVSMSDCGSQGPEFGSHWRQNSAHDHMALHCTEPFIIPPAYIVCRRLYAEGVYSFRPFH